MGKWIKNALIGWACLLGFVAAFLALSYGISFIPGVHADGMPRMVSGFFALLLFLLGSILFFVFSHTLAKEVSEARREDDQ